MIVQAKDRSARVQKLDQICALLCSEATDCGILVTRNRTALGGPPSLLTVVEGRTETMWGGRVLLTHTVSSSEHIELADEAERDVGAEADAKVNVVNP